LSAPRRMEDHTNTILNQESVSPHRVSRSG
jgi:hypothetical protein